MLDKNGNTIHSPCICSECQLLRRRIAMKEISQLIKDLKEYPSNYFVLPKSEVEGVSVAMLEVYKYQDGKYIYVDFIRLS